MLINDVPISIKNKIIWKYRRLYTCINVIFRIYLHDIFLDMLSYDRDVSSSQVKVYLVSLVATSSADTKFHLDLPDTYPDISQWNDSWHTFISNMWSTHDRLLDAFWLVVTFEYVANRNTPCYMPHYPSLICDGMCLSTQWINKPWLGNTASCWAVPVAQSVARSTLDREDVSSSRADCTGRFPVLRMRQ